MVPLFFTGILYGALDEAYDEIKNWTKDEIMEAYVKSPQTGLKTTLMGKKLSDWGKIFLNISKKGLEKRNEINSNNKNETIYLKHIEDIIEKKTNRAELLLEKFNKQGDLEFFNYNNEDFSYSGL